MAELGNCGLITGADGAVCMTQIHSQSTLVIETPTKEHVKIASSSKLYINLNEQYHFCQEESSSIQSENSYRLVAKEDYISIGTHNFYAGATGIFGGMCIMSGQSLYHRVFYVVHYSDILVIYFNR